MPAAIGLNPFRSGQCLSTTYNERSCNFNRVSIPFDQGNVFRHLTVTTINALGTVSIPFDQGNVFRPNGKRTEKSKYSSQSLSIRAMSFDRLVLVLLLKVYLVSIPFDQGNVFRLIRRFILCLSRSQSLSIRAMSFDCSGMLEAGIMRPFRPTSQFFWKVKELALDLSK